MTNIFTHMCGAGIGILAFGVSLIIGLIVDNSFLTIMKRSLLMLMAFYLLGAVLSALGQHAVKEFFDRSIHKDASPAENSFAAPNSQAGPAEKTSPTQVSASTP